MHESHIFNLSNSSGLFPYEGRPTLFQFLNVPPPLPHPPLTFAPFLFSLSLVNSWRNMSTPFFLISVSTRTLSHLTNSAFCPHVLQILLYFTPPTQFSLSSKPILLYVEFSLMFKVFDSVPHSPLLKLLQSYDFG